MQLRSNKQVLQLLQLDFGIGFYRSRLLLKYCGINLNSNLRIKKYLYYSYHFRIKRILAIRTWSITDRLKYRRIQYSFFIKNLINYYKYLRLKYGLPVRGQRTHSNRQTISRHSKSLMFNDNLLVKKKKKLMIIKRKRYKNIFFKYLFNKKKKKIIKK